ncbi:hypothetical protein BC936DRAFT_140579 [Jimgerdemannia flammicorona]|uniref:Peptidase A2 domain-containing protein n=1 Tax=Jimgerdemannia flammicorona TaxID=994334 RepID=A0A433AL20_9FUNG|nr:hypothetical protein BC936DRAFT_140579 [Jimgerdemannia flammicorona]
MSSESQVSQTYAQPLPFPTMMVIPDNLRMKKVEEWDRADLLEFLNANKAKYFISDRDIQVIGDKVAGTNFLDLTRKILTRKSGGFELPYAPATRIADLVEELKTARGFGLVGGPGSGQPDSEQNIILFTGDKKKRNLKASFFRRIPNIFKAEKDGKSSNPPETRESLHIYERQPGQAQKFLDCMGKNFRWPSSMPELFKSQAFKGIIYADDDEESVEYIDNVAAFNLLSFYDKLDKGDFVGHENEWVVIHNQAVERFGPELKGDEGADILEAMPGAIQLPVDQSRLSCSKPAKKTVDSKRTADGSDHKVQVRVRRIGASNEGIATIPYDFVDKGSRKPYTCVIDTGAPATVLPYDIRLQLGKLGWTPAEQICACRPFEVSIGDDNHWTKWVQIQGLLVWEKDPGDQVKYALVGNDVTDQLAYAHEPKGVKRFLDASDEAKFGRFLSGCS